MMPVCAKLFEMRKRNKKEKQQEGVAMFDGCANTAAPSSKNNVSKSVHFPRWVTRKAAQQEAKPEDPDTWYPFSIIKEKTPKPITPIPMTKQKEQEVRSDVHRTAFKDWCELHNYRPVGESEGQVRRTGKIRPLCKAFAT